MRLHAGRSNPSRPRIPILPCDAQSYTAVTLQRERPDYRTVSIMEQPDRGDAAFAGTSGSRETTQNLGPVSLRSLPGVLGEPLARGTVTVLGDSRPAARSKASKRHPSTGNLSGKAFDRPSDRRRSYGPAGGPGPAPAGDSGSVADRRSGLPHRARTRACCLVASYLRAATAGHPGCRAHQAAELW
jgi:hypothetical protein